MTPVFIALSNGTIYFAPHGNPRETRRVFSVRNGSAVIHAVRTSGEKFISSLHCVAKKEKSKRVPELGGRELTDLSPDVLTA